MESFNLERFAHIVKCFSKRDNEYVIVSPIQNSRRIQRLKTFSSLLNNNQYFEKYLAKYELREDKEWTCAVILCSTLNENKDLHINLDDLYATAVSLIKDCNRDKEKSLELFHKLNLVAMSGDMKCQNALASFHCNGIGTEQNKNKAFEWYLKSANQGFAPAIMNLSTCYIKGIGTEIDYKKAAELLTKLRNSGFIKSYNNLAICYMYGLGVETDIKKAINLLEYAVKKNEPGAQCHLGQCYLLGKGVEKDVIKGLNLLKAASNTNNIVANRYLGKCYRTGLEVEVDMAAAIKYYTKAGLLADKKSIIALIEIFEEKDYKDLFGDEQFDVFVKGVHLGMPEISRVTFTWLNKEPEGTKDGDVVYGSNGLRIVKTLEHEYDKFVF